MATIEFIKTLIEFINENNVTFDHLYEHSSAVLKKYIQYINENSLFLTNYLNEQNNLMSKI